MTEFLLMAFGRQNQKSGQKDYKTKRKVGRSERSNTLITIL